MDTTLHIQIRITQQLNKLNTNKCSNPAHLNVPQQKHVNTTIDIQNNKYSSLPQLQKKHFNTTSIFGTDNTMYHF